MISTEIYILGLINLVIRINYHTFIAEFKKIKVMNKELKSLLIMLTVFGLYVYATIGILKLLRLTDDKQSFISYVSTIMVSIFAFSLIYIIGIGKLVTSHEVVMDLYGGFIIFNLIYLVVGNILNTFIQFNLKN
jgi:hypothetical protein